MIKGHMTKAPLPPHIEGNLKSVGSSWNTLRSKVGVLHFEFGHDTLPSSRACQWTPCVKTDTLCKYFNPKTSPQGAVAIIKLATAVPLPLLRCCIQRCCIWAKDVASRQHLQMLHLGKDATLPEQHRLRAAGADWLGRRPGTRYPARPRGMAAQHGAMGRGGALKGPSRSG